MLLDKYINDLTIPIVNKNTLYIVYEMSEKGTKLVRVTKSKNKLNEYTGSLY